MDIQLPTYNVVIPTALARDTLITPKARLVYGEVAAICAKYGACVIPNHYLSMVFDMDKDTASNLISVLSEANYIERWIDGTLRTISLPNHHEIVAALCEANQVDTWQPETLLFDSISEGRMQCGAPKSKKEKNVAVGYVYVMVDRLRGYHKIGFSKQPEYREKTLQAEVPTIEMIGKFLGSMADERLLHQLFAALKIRGEWFNLTDADLSSIEDYFYCKN